MKPASYLLLLALISGASGCAQRAKVARPETLALRSGPQAIQVLADEELFARVVLNEGETASIEALFAHGGRHLLRGFPLNPRPGESVDHPEHLSMWTAHGSVGGFNLWGDATGPRLIGHALRVLGDGRAALETELEWRSPTGATLCSEERTYEFYANSELRTVDVIHELTAPGTGTRFGDVREGFFALRLDDAFRQDRDGGEVLTSVKIPGLDPYGLPARWVAYTASLPDAMGNEEEVTLVVFDHPDNPGYPTRWFARPYGIVAANPFAVTAFEDPDTLENLGEPEGFQLQPYGSVTLKYRVAIGHGRLDAEAIEELWAEWRR